MADEVSEKSRLKTEIADVRAQIEKWKCEAKLEKEELSRELRGKDEELETRKRENEDLKVAEGRQKRRVEELTRSLDIVSEKYRKTLLAAKTEADAEKARADAKKAEADAKWQEFQEWQEENGRPVQD